MGLSHSPSIVTNGLVLCLDASNIKSYPGSGNNVYDLTNNASNITFYNTAVISEGAFDFTALNTDGLSIAGSDYEGLTDFTMECLFKISGTHQNYDGALMSSGNWNGAHWALSVIQNNSGIRTRNPGITWSFAFSVGSWYHVIYRRSGTTLSCFINGIKQADQTSASNIPLTSDATNTAIGRETYAGGYFNLNGKIATCRIYNRALSDSEAIQNFVALRGRYGL